VSGMNRAAAVPMYAAAIDAGTGGRAAALHSGIRWRAKGFYRVGLCVWM